MTVLSPQWDFSYTGKMTSLYWIRAQIPPFFDIGWQGIAILFFCCCRFSIVGYGCMTCIGNSGPLEDSVSEAIDKGDLVACGVLSGNRNFEGRIHPKTRANYLASPPLVIAYALAGTVAIDFEAEPIGEWLQTNRKRPLGDAQPGILTQDTLLCHILHWYWAGSWNPREGPIHYSQ